MPRAVDPLEPEHVAAAAGELGLTHIVVTSVDRDDLPDGGATHYAACVRAIKERCPQTAVEAHRSLVGCNLNHCFARSEMSELAIQ